MSLRQNKTWQWHFQFHPSKNQIVITEEVEKQWFVGTILVITPNLFRHVEMIVPNITANSNQKSRLLIIPVGIISLIKKCCLSFSKKIKHLFHGLPAVGHLGLASVGCLCFSHRLWASLIRLGPLENSPSSFSSLKSNLPWRIQFIKCNSPHTLWTIPQPISVRYHNPFTSAQFWAVCFLYYGEGELKISGSNFEATKCHVQWIFFGGNLAHSLRYTCLMTRLLFLTDQVTDLFYGARETLRIWA